MNTVPHPDEFRFWPKFRRYARTEEEAEVKSQEGRLRWARHSKSSFESMTSWHRENPQHGGYHPTEAKRKQYEAACRILVERAILNSL